MSDWRDGKKLVVTIPSGKGAEFDGDNVNFKIKEDGSLLVFDGVEEVALGVYPAGKWDGVGFHPTTKQEEPPKSIQEQVRLFFELTYAAPSGEPGLFGAFVSGWDARKIYEDKIEMERSRIARASLLEAMLEVG